MLVSIALRLVQMPLQLCVTPASTAQEVLRRPVPLHRPKVAVSARQKLIVRQVQLLLNTVRVVTTIRIPEKRPSMIAHYAHQDSTAKVPPQLQLLETAPTVITAEVARL